MYNTRAKIIGLGGKCEVCEAVLGVKVLQVGAHAIALCEECRDSVAKVISVDLLEERFMPDEYRRPVCNYCGRKGHIDEGTHNVSGYEILNSCHACEYSILHDEE